MTSTAKLRGDRAEREVVTLLAELTGWPVRRALGLGRNADRGDVDGLPLTCIQVKNYRDIARAVRDALTELPRQAENAETPFAVAFIRQPGGRYFVALTPEVFVSLLREATAP